jgi:hypothetical protein
LGKNPQITLEQVADAANTLATVLWKHQRHWSTHVATCCNYYQERNVTHFKGRIIEPLCTVGSTAVTVSKKE